MKYFLLSLLLLSACSTLKDEDCRMRDWYVQGYSDGERGYDPEMFKTHIMVCEEDITKIKQDKYSEGYRKGADRYCKYRQGFLVGESGRPFPRVCKGRNYPRFIEGYNAGKKKALKQEGLK